MSSRRYQEDIRRIVGLQDTLRGLDDDLPRMRIDGARGIFMIGAGETKSGSSGGTDDDGNKTDPVMPDENEDNQNEDGSGAGGDGTDPSGTDGDDLVIDPEAPGNYSPDDTTFGDGWGSGGVSTFQDCVDGKCIEIVERGGYVPPEGWDSADDPPLDPTYQEGLGWEVNQSGAFSTPVGAFLSEFGPHTKITTSCHSGSPCTVYLVTGRRTSNNTTTSAFVSRVVCEDCTDGIRPTHWPSDNCIQLAPNADGQWAASQYENPSDMTAKYSEPKSILDLCTPNGDGVQILPGADGGSVRWNYTQGRFMATSPDGRRSFGGATEITTAVAGSVAGGGAIKASGAAVPSS